MFLSSFSLSLFPIVCLSPFSLSFFSTVCLFPAPFYLLSIYLASLRLFFLSFCSNISLYILVVLSPSLTPSTTSFPSFLQFGSNYLPLSSFFHLHRVLINTSLLVVSFPPSTPTRRNIFLTPTHTNPPSRSAAASMVPTPPLGTWKGSESDMLVGPAPPPSSSPSPSTLDDSRPIVADRPQCRATSSIGSRARGGVG